MVFSTWYTDLMDVYRMTETVSGGITRQERTLIAASVPCRVYRSQADNYTQPRGAAKVRRAEKLSCAVDTDILAGDELLVTRGGALNRGRSPVRYFAGDPQAFFDPVGGALTGLEHLEVGITADDIAKTGGV